MFNYAKGTKIQSSKSEQDIRNMLKKFGAVNIVPIDELIVGEKVFIGVVFEYENRRVKITVELPDPESEKFTHTAGGKQQRTETQRHQSYLKEVDRLWRALTLKIKAKLIAIEENISDFEEEFLADIMMPNGQTVKEFLLPQLNQVYLTGKMPPLLPGMGETA